MNIIYHLKIYRFILCPDVVILFGTKPGNDRDDCSKEDKCIKRQREIFDVVKIIPQLEMDIRQPRHMALIYLCPAADAGRYSVAIAVKWQLLFVPGG